MGRVNQEYDIFETLSAVNWVGLAWARGPHPKKTTLVELSKSSANKFFAMHIPSNEILSFVNHERGNDAAID